MREAGSRPDFIIGGAPRSGTTFLCHALDRDPRVFLPTPFIPEPKVLVHPGLSEADCMCRYQALFSGAPSGTLSGEKTSYYLESSLALDYVKRYLPETKMIFLVREPVARAFSNYLWTCKNGMESKTFEDAVASEASRPDPMPPEKAYVRPFDYLSRGTYARYAEAYLEALGPQRVGFFVYEQLMQDPVRRLGEIQEFLGLEPTDLGVDASERINAVPEPAQGLEPALEERLRAQMRDQVLAFGTLTGLDLSSWGY